MIICNIPQPSLFKQLFLPVSIAITSAWMTYKFTVYRERRHKKEHLNGILIVLSNLMTRNLIDVKRWLSKHEDDDVKSLVTITETNYHEIFSQVAEYPKYLIQCTSIMSNFDFKNTTEFIYVIQANGNTVRSRGQKKYLSRGTANNLAILFERAIGELTAYQEEILSELRAKSFEAIYKLSAKKIKLLKVKCKGMYH